MPPNCRLRPKRPGSTPRSGSSGISGRPWSCTVRRWRRSEIVDDHLRRLLPMSALVQVPRTHRNKAVNAEPSQRDDVLSKGFTVVRDVVDLDVVGGGTKRWRLVAHQRANLTERTAIDDNMVHNPMLSDLVFLEVLDHPAVVGALDTFLGDTSLVYAFTTSSMPKGGSNYSRRVHVDRPRVIPGYITNLGVIIALDGFTEDNGATYFLPGSFERIDAPTEDEFFAGAERVFAESW